MGPTKEGGSGLNDPRHPFNKPTMPRGTIVGIEAGGKTYELIARLLKDERAALVRAAQEETGGLQEAAIEQLVTATIAMRELRIDDGK